MKLYASDVLAGLAVGAAVVLIGYLTVVPSLTRRVTYLSAMPLGSLFAASPPSGTELTGTTDPTTAAA